LRQAYPLETALARTFATVSLMHNLCVACRGAKPRSKTQPLIGIAMKSLLLIPTLLFLSSCATPTAPSPQQEKYVEEIQLFKSGESPARKYVSITEVGAINCSGAPGGGRLWGSEALALNELKLRAKGLGAEAVVNARCGAAPLVNNCWAAKECVGTAVKWAE
jgi:hypothetical protein